VSDHVPDSPAALLAMLEAARLATVLAEDTLAELGQWRSDAARGDEQAAEWLARARVIVGEAEP
jgi:hypothetical protein